MIVDPPSEIAQDAFFVPSPKSFWELMSQETMPELGFLLNDDSNDIQNILTEVNIPFYWPYEMIDLLRAVFKLEPRPFQSHNQLYQKNRKLATPIVRSPTCLEL